MPMATSVDLLRLLLVLLTLSSTTATFHHHHIASHNYRDALTKSILFFEGQRSGKLPPNQRMTWRRNSGLSDGSAMKVDLVGGYYDAGDNMKFGFPMAFTTTMLSWSVLEFGGMMKSELGNAKTAIRWATDYLLKATLGGTTSMLEPKFFSLKHFFFKTFILSMITKVMQIPSSAHLFQTPHLLKPNTPQVRFHRLITDYQDSIIKCDHNHCSIVQISLKLVATGGLLFKTDDSNMQYVTSTTFLLTTYAKYLTRSHTVVNCGGAVVTPRRLRTIVKKQVDYLLGDNPMKMSFMVGYGSRYPQRIHHRGSSLPSIAAHPAKIDCGSGFDFMRSEYPNPNVLIGAVVGGPDDRDRYSDDRSEYFQSEPTTYTNAPLVGTLAYLAHSFGQI